MSGFVYTDDGVESIASTMIFPFMIKFRYGFFCTGHLFLFFFILFHANLSFGVTLKIDLFDGDTLCGSNGIVDKNCSADIIYVLPDDTLRYIQNDSIVVCIKPEGELLAGRFLLALNIRSMHANIQGRDVMVQPAEVLLDGTQDPLLSFLIMQALDVQLLDSAFVLGNHLVPGLLSPRWEQLNEMDSCCGWLGLKGENTDTAQYRFRMHCRDHDRMVVETDTIRLSDNMRWRIQSCYDPENFYRIPEEQRVMLELVRGDELFICHGYRRRQLYSGNLSGLTDDVNHKINEEVSGLQCFLRDYNKLYITPWAAIPVRRLIRFNDYEGWAPGLGIELSNVLKHEACLTGYARYGLKSEEVRYGGALSLTMDSHVHLLLEGHHDIQEPGVFLFPEELSGVQGVDFRALLVKQVDQSRWLRGGLTIHMQDNWTFFSGLEHESRAPLYSTLISGEKMAEQDVSAFSFLMGLKKRWGDVQHEESSVGQRWTEVRLWYSQGTSFAGGELPYARCAADIEFDYPVAQVGHIKGLIKGRWSHAYLPYSWQCVPSGSFRKFNFFSSWNFMTMGLNEFVTSYYGAIFLQYHFPALVKRRYFRPSPVVVFNYGVGGRYAESIGFKGIRDMSQGYAETGLLLNGIMVNGKRQVGLGLFYRGGSYGYEKSAMNYSFLITLNQQLW